jgi:hypothetical protein
MGSVAGPSRRRGPTRPPPDPVFRTNLGVTSIYLQGIDPGEIIDTVHARRPPMIPASAGLALAIHPLT